MAAPLVTCTKEEQRSVTRFLIREGVKPIEVHRRMKVQYGDACLSQQQVYEWNMTMLGPILPVQQLQQSKTCLHFECLPHPPYSPDLAPSDYHRFGPLKEAMGGKKFRSDEEVQQAVHEWLRRQAQEFFSRGIHALRKRWRACIERNGDYVEKLYSCVPLSFNKLNLKKILRFSFDSPS
jgi:predicted amidophosphoribosyltransferase